MGSLFRYIADGVVEPVYDPPCDVCGSSSRPCFSYFAALDDSNDVSERGVCANCINSGKIRRNSYTISEISRVIEKHGSDLERLIEAYCTIPDRVFINGPADWPLCCDDWCELTGHPATLEEAKDVPGTHTEWSLGPYGTEFNAVYELRPECIEEVYLFECLSCDNKFHIHSPT